MTGILPQQILQKDLVTPFLRVPEPYWNLLFMSSFVLNTKSLHLHLAVEAGILCELLSVVHLLVLLCELVSVVHLPVRKRTLI